MENADHLPMALPRRSSGKPAPSRARLVGTRRAAPSPWMALAAMSQWIVGAEAQPTEAAANSPTPSAKIRRRPTLSAEGAADQEERGEAEGVALHHPLDLAWPWRRGLAGERAGRH